MVPFILSGNILSPSMYFCVTTVTVVDYNQSIYHCLVTSITVKVFDARDRQTELSL